MDSKRGLNKIFCDFLQFFEAPDLPQIEQILQKSKKNIENLMLKKTIFSHTIFQQIFVVLPSENEAKIQYFSIFFPNRRFNEN